MRVVTAMAALMLLAGCGQIAPGAEKGPRQDEFATSDSAAAFAGASSGFDYRYAFRLPGNRVKAVIQSNADACDRIGPARCRILAMRYRVEASNHIRAVLTIRIDPAIARPFGEAVTKSVTGVDGVLVDTTITGADSTAAARSIALVSRLREQQRNAEAIANGGGSDAAAARTRADRIKSALQTIAEVEAGQGQSLATAPVLITYESSNALTGLGASPDANFRNAGQTFQNSLAYLANVAASVGPWLVAVLLLVLVLRWIVHGRAVGNDPEPSAVPVEPREDRNLIRRWFSRDEDEDGQAG